MSEWKDLMIIIFNDSDITIQRVQVRSISITKMLTTAQGNGIEITNVVLDAYGLCVRTADKKQSAKLKALIEENEALRKKANAEAAAK